MKLMRSLTSTLALVAMIAATGCTPVSVSFTFGAHGDRLRERVVIAERPTSRDKIALIDIRGLITELPRPGLLGSRPSPVDELVARLERAEKDSRVRAIVLRINSPGGTVTGSDLMYGEIRRFAERTGKPVVASLGEVAASGGYYAALAADRIVAQPTSLTGSIGVIFPTINVSEGLARIGIHARAITSGPNKDMGDPLSPPVEEHYRILQSIVDEHYARFRSLVRKRRPDLDPDHVQQATDGRVLTGTQALGWGLVDAVGSLRDAYELARTLAGAERARLVKYASGSARPRSPYAASAPAPVSTGPPSLNLSLVNLDMGSWAWASSSAWYLWLPPSP